MPIVRCALRARMNAYCICGGGLLLFLILRASHNTVTLDFPEKIAIFLSSNLSVLIMAPQSVCGKWDNGLVLTTH